jgi:hypothetical protein
VVEVMEAKLSGERHCREGKKRLEEEAVGRRLQGEGQLLLEEEVVARRQGEVQKSWELRLEEEEEEVMGAPQLGEVQTKAMTEQLMEVERQAGEAMRRRLEADGRVGEATAGGLDLGN